MTELSRIRRAAALAGCTVALSLGALAATPAFAATSGATPVLTASTTVVRASAVQPDSDHGCTTGSSSGNVETCFYIVGGGLNVSSMKTTSCVVNSGRTLHDEITGPSFTRNSDQEYIAPGYCLEFTLTVNGDVAAGTYHGITWRYNGGSSYTNIGEVSLPVSA